MTVPSVMICSSFAIDRPIYPRAQPPQDYCLGRSDISGLSLGIFVSFEASLVGTIAGGVALILIGRRMLAHLLDRVDYLLYQAF